MRSAMVKGSQAAAVATLLATGIFAAPAAAQPRSSELICSVAAGGGFFVFGKQGASCVYYRGDGTVEFYVGSSSKLGVDLGFTNAQRLAFQVAGVDPSAPAALQGTFAGPSAGVSLGFGLSGEAMVGGAGGRAVLIPQTNQGYTGIAVNAALGALTLRYAGHETRTVRERY